MGGFPGRGELKPPGSRCQAVIPFDRNRVSPGKVCYILRFDQIIWKTARAVNEPKKIKVARISFS